MKQIIKWARSSRAEHLACTQEAPGSNPGESLYEERTGKFSLFSQPLLWYNWDFKLTKVLVFSCPFKLKKRGGILELG